MLTRDYPPRTGGIAVHSEALVTQLTAMGVTVDVFVGGSDLGTTLLPLKSDFDRYDIVHVQSSPYGLFIAKKRLVVTVHATVLTELNYYTASQKFKSIPAIVFEKLTLNKAKVIIAVSNATKEDLVSRYGVEETKISVIGNGIDFDRFAVGRNLPMKPFNILMVSRLEPRKNVEEAIRILAKLSGDDYRARIVGTGSQKAKLEQLASKVGARVEFLGVVSEDRLPNIYTESDIFLSTSLSEGFGISVLEAMAAGCAVVASDIVTHRDLITDGTDGILYDGPSDLEVKLRWLTSAPSVIRALGEKARENARRYSWREVAQRVLRAYERCINA